MNAATRKAIETVALENMVSDMLTAPATVPEVPGFTYDYEAGEYVQNVPAMTPYQAYSKANVAFDTFYRTVFSLGIGNDENIQTALTRLANERDEAFKTWCDSYQDPIQTCGQPYPAN